MRMPPSIGPGTPVVASGPFDGVFRLMNAAPAPIQSPEALGPSFVATDVKDSADA
jgi:hypothetical protein